jgi:hypothetical protein
MTDNKRNHKQEEGQNYILVPSEHRFRWKTIHQSWTFWIFLFLMLVAILYYIVSVDFIFAPHK